MAKTYSHPKGYTHKQKIGNVRLYSQMELAKLIGTSPQTLSRLVKSGHIKADKCGLTGLPKFSFERCNEILAELGLKPLVADE